MIGSALDERLLPPLARRARRIAERLARGRQPARGVHRPHRQHRPAGAPGLLLVSAGLVAGVGVAVVQAGGDQPARTVAPVLDLPASSFGPAPGMGATAYVEASRRRAVQLSGRTPDSEYAALISFRRYLTPDQTRLALGDLAVSKVVLHARLPTAEVYPVAVADVVGDLYRLYAVFVQRKLQDQQELAALSASPPQGASRNGHFRAFYAAAAAAAGQEAAAYRSDCACVVAAVVRGEAKDLAALPALDVVRAVQVGGRQLDDAMPIRALLPEQLVAR